MRFRHVLNLTLILLSTLVLAQTLDPLEVEVEGTTLTLTDTLPTDAGVRSGVLPNGLSYYLRHNEEPRNRADMALVVRAGSTSEDDDQQGVAHFLEHMLFNGTENFAGQEIINFLERAGMAFGPDVNAYTSFDETVYTLQIPLDSEDVVATSLDILYDWATNATLASEEIDKERGVIVEEERLRSQNVSGRLNEALLPVLLGDSRYAQRLPIGDLETIRTAPREAFSRFYDTYYRPDNMAVVVVGDFNVDAFEQRIIKAFSPLENPADTLPLADYDVPLSGDPVYFVFTDPEFPVTAAQVTYKSEGGSFNTVADFLDVFRKQLFSIMVNNRLAERARTDDPPYLNASVAIGASIGGLEDVEFTVVTPEGELERGVNALFEEALRVQQFGFTETELARAKTEVLTGLEQNYNERDDLDSSFWRSALVDAFLNDTVVTSNLADLELGQQLLPRLSVEDINAVAPDFDSPENRVAVILAPQKEGLVVPDEAQLEMLLTTALNQAVSAYQDATPEGDLLTVTLEPVAITDESYVPELDTTLFTLANGIQVIFKPTDFVAEDVSVSGVSYGGTSLYSDEDAVEASLAANIVSESGVGDYSLVQLERLLTGKNVGVGVSIGDLTETIGGSSDAEDLETLFQLIYLYATAPREDAAAFERVKDSLETNILNRDSQPQTVFGDAITMALYGDDARYLPLTLEQVAGLDYSRALEIYRERFADMGDFTFTVVGDTDLETVKDLVQLYLGNLPATSRTETWRNRLPPLPMTTLETDVYKGLEEQSLLHIRFDGPFFNPERKERFKLFVLERVLDLRMREAIREELGGSYSPQVFSNYEQRPSKRYTLGVQFSADPQRVDELSEAAFKVFKTMRDEGPSDDDLQKAKEQIRRSLEENLENNNYWSFVLPFYFFSNPDENPLDILNYEDLLASIRGEDIHMLAQQFIVLDRYIEVVLFPEAYAE